MVLRYIQAFDIDNDKINVNGGAIALGHPLGATGAMIFGTVLDELERTDKSTALVTLCIGGGMGTATIIERVLSRSREESGQSAPKRPSLTSRKKRWARREIPPSPPRRGEGRARAAAAKIGSDDMTYKNFKVETDADGIALVTWDIPAVR